MIIDGDQTNLGKILDYNKCLLKLFGYSTNEMANSTLDKFLPDIYVKEHHNVLEKAVI